MPDASCQAARRPRPLNLSSRTRPWWWRSAFRRSGFGVRGSGFGVQRSAFVSAAYSRLPPLSYNRVMVRVITWRIFAVASGISLLAAPLALRPAAQARPASGLDLASVSAARIIAHATLLADDLYEGRAPGSRGGDLAARYIATQFALRCAGEAQVAEGKT